MQRRIWVVVALAFMTAGCGNERNGYHASNTSPASTGMTATMGRPGDHWADTMQFVRVARAQRGSRYGYEVTYEAIGGTTFTLFWSRDQIDLRGALPNYRLENMPLGHGRLLYPDTLTKESLPDVYQAIQLIEDGYAGDAEGAITAAEMFGVVAALGGVGPSVRAPRTSVPSPKRVPPARARVPGGQAAGGGGNVIRWGFWDDLPKVVRNGREYAHINGRLYTRHAIDRMSVRGFGTAAGKTGSSGRGVPTMVVEDVIRNGRELGRRVIDGATRIQRKRGNVSVVTEGDIVITVITH